MAYEVLDPTKVHFGKTYSTLVEEWFNWFVTSDADKRTSGQVVFLRSMGVESYSSLVPNDSGAGNDQSAESTYAEDPYFARRYKNNPNIRIGRDKLQICIDQAVFFPIIMAYQESTKPYHDYGFMQDYAGSTIDHGSNPPEVGQLTINGEPIVLPRGREMREFRIATSVFTAVVPDTDYGRSAKDFLQMALPSGNYPMMAEGYYVLLKFNDPGTYVVYSYANAGRETQAGTYFSEFLYEIQVNGCSEKVSIGDPRFKSVRGTSLMRQLIVSKVNSGELLAGEAKTILTRAKIMSGADADKLLKQG
jgi:hypothetical protein